MITAIIDLVFKILNLIIKLLISAIMSIFPNMELDGFVLGIKAFFDLLGNAINLVYFMFGNTCFIIADIIIIITTIKLVIIPIISFLRKVIIHQ